ncbi:MAG: redoxin domain-containing protein [Taibaiella sp.]|nr:redoxin domain-containing protein [Taibaiella sp.]
MRHILLTLLFIGSSCHLLFAKDGYTVKLKFTDLKDQKVFLAHYYGKPLPTIYKVDSATIDSKGVGLLQSDAKIIGGLYLLILADNSSYTEFLLDNGQMMEMTLSKAKLPLAVSFKNSPENERFQQYVSFLDKVSKQHKELSDDLAQAKTTKDTAAIQEKFRALSIDVSRFRKDYIQQNKGTLLANIFKALETPEVPELKKEDGTADNEARYIWYKEHYWDNVAFEDERLVYTPLLGNKLQEYFGKLVLAIPDTFNTEADALVKKARASREVFKYVVHWITTYAQESDIMGMDAVFVHMVENYYMKGEAFWLSSGTLEKYVERARSIAPNVIGNIAPELKLQQMNGKEVSLHDLDAKYTLLVFWSPDCGHCEEEIPRIDSAIKAEGLYKKGMRVVGVNIDRETEKWQRLIKNKNLDNWIHVYDPERKSDFRAKYDVYGTPSVYLLDEKKIIRGKKLDHQNMLTVIEILEGKVSSKN